MNIISVREQPQYTQQIIAYLQQCWNKMAPILYSDCISHCVDALHPLPQWYVLEKEGEFTIRSADVLVLLDGKEYKRFPVDLTEKGQEAYKNAASKKLERIPESDAPAYSRKDDSGIYYERYVYWMDQGWDVPEGSIVEFYVEVVDETGLRYRSFLEWFEASGSEEAIRQMDEKSPYMGAEPVLIFDETGTIVYELVPGLFR